MTAQELINRSLTLCGRLGAGRGAGVSESTVALGILNAIFDEWNTDGLIVYSIESATHTLTGGTGNYTIGSGGDFDVAASASTGASTCSCSGSSPKTAYRSRILSSGLVNSA